MLQVSNTFLPMVQKSDGVESLTVRITGMKTTVCHWQAEEEVIGWVGCKICLFG